MILLGKCFMNFFLIIFDTPQDVSSDTGQRGVFSKKQRLNTSLVVNWETDKSLPESVYLGTGCVRLEDFGRFGCAGLIYLKYFYIF